MPLYDYECKDCGEFSEIQHRISAIGDVHPCTKCESENTIKVLISAPKLADPMRLGTNKSTSSFKDTLQKIHERNPGSSLNEIM